MMCALLITYYSSSVGRSATGPVPLLPIYYTFIQIVLIIYSFNLIIRGMQYYVVPQLKILVFVVCVYVCGVMLLACVYVW